jgi:hypothetical protein
VSSRAALTQPDTPIQGTGVGAAAWDGARRQQQTPCARTVLAPASVPREDAHLQRICQVFSQVRGRTGAR